jgi:hypothetical protein
MVTNMAVFASSVEVTDSDATVTKIEMTDFISGNIGGGDICRKNEALALGEANA